MVCPVQTRMFLGSCWQWHCDSLDGKYTILANRWRKPLCLHSKGEGSNTVWGVTQITHRQVRSMWHVFSILYFSPREFIHSFLTLHGSFFPKNASLHTGHRIISHFQGPTTHFLILVTWQLPRFFLLRWYLFVPFISFIFPSGSIAINQIHKIKLNKINISAGGNSGNINN